MSIKIEGAIASKIGFASHQNAVPVVRELVLSHHGDTVYQDILLELKADPPFLELKTWRLDRLSPGESLRIDERDIRLNAGYLADLSESLKAEVSLCLTCSESLLSEERYPVELLAKTEWGGVSAMPELLAAFCMPNDPAVAVSYTHLTLPTILLV